MQRWRSNLQLLVPFLERPRIELLSLASDPPACMVQVWLLVLVLHVCKLGVEGSLLMEACMHCLPLHTVCVHAMQSANRACVVWIARHLLPWARELRHTRGDMQGHGDQNMRMCRLSGGWSPTSDCRGARWSTSWGRLSTRLMHPVQRCPPVVWRLCVFRSRDTSCAGHVALHANCMQPHAALCCGTAAF